MSAPRFSIMPGWVFTDPRVKPMDLKVLGILGRHIDRNGWCTRSQVRLADELRVARSTVQASLNRLRGIGIVQKRQNHTEDGRDCSHDYRVLYDVEVELLQPDCDGAEDSIEGPENTPPADISAPLAKRNPCRPKESAPPADPLDRHPIRTTPKERTEREARAREPISGEDEKVDRATIPGTADFQKRVMKFCNGNGFTAGPWPDWDTSSPGYIGKQFEKLSESERQAGERWRDAYLRDLATRKRKPVPVGVFIRDRLWEGLDPELMLRAERAAQQGSKAGELAKPDGWAKGYGPVWAAAVFETMMGGMQYPEHRPTGPIWLVNNLQRAWPKLYGLQQVASTRGGLVLPERLHAVAGQMEFVPRDSAVWSDWMDVFGDRGWPDVLPSGMDGGYFPKGGPAGLDAFAEELVARQGELKQSEGAQ